MAEDEFLRERVAKIMRLDSLKQVILAEISEIVGFTLDTEHDMVHFKGPRLIMSMPLSKALEHFEKLGK